MFEPKHPPPSPSPSPHKKRKPRITEHPVPKHFDETFIFLPSIRYFGLFRFVQLMDIDEKEMTMVSYIWLRFSWVDQTLTWNPQDYGGLSHIK